MTWLVVKGGAVSFEAVDEEGTTGLRQAMMVGSDEGSLHMEVALVELASGGSVAGHVHPFEESFFILEGEVLVTVADRSHRLSTNDFGFVPISTVHAWRNPGSKVTRWLRTRSPQPRSIGKASGTYWIAGEPPPMDGSPIQRPDITRRFVDHFSNDDLPSGGPLQLKGFRSIGSTNVAVRMLVDEVIGAVHHTMFVAEFSPTGHQTLGGDHFHPFEEAYYFIEGTAIAHLEGNEVEVRPGDLVFAGVNAFHGFTNLTPRPVRWIELQAPMPPPSSAFFFRRDWS